MTCPIWQELEAAIKAFREAAATGVDARIVLERAELLASAASAALEQRDRQQIAAYEWIKRCPLGPLSRVLEKPNASAKKTERYVEALAGDVFLPATFTGAFERQISRRTYLETGCVLRGREAILPAIRYPDGRVMVLEIGQQSDATEPMSTLYTCAQAVRTKE